MNYPSWAIGPCRGCAVVDLREPRASHSSCEIANGDKKWTCKSGAVKVNLWTRFFLWRRVGPGGAPISIVWGYKDWILNYWGRFKINLKYDLEHGRFPRGWLRRNGLIKGLCYSPLFYWRILQKYGWHWGGWRYTWLWSAMSWVYLLVTLILVVAWAVTK